MADDKSTALHAKWVWVNDEEGERIECDRWVVVEGEHISGIGRDAPAGAERIELPECLVLPGLVNAHNHSVSSVVFRGITEDWDAEAYETELIYGLLMPLGDLAIETLEAGEMQAVVELALLELLKGGTTTLVEIFRNRQHGTFEAAERMGLRFYGAPYLFSTGALTMDADGEPAYAARDADESDLDRCLALRARGRRRTPDLGGAVHPRRRGRDRRSRCAGGAESLERGAGSRDQACTRLVQDDVDGARRERGPHPGTLRQRRRVVLALEIHLASDQAHIFRP